MNPVVFFQRSLPLLVCVFFTGLRAQSPLLLTLKEAYSLAEQHYPLLSKEVLLRDVSELNLQLIQKGQLPALSLNGFAQYQSENLGIGSPGSPVDLNLPLESYKTYLDANYALFDGGIARAKIASENASLELNHQELRSSLRNLKDRVNNLFFLIKLARRQASLLDISLENISLNIESLQAGYANGTILRSELFKLKVKKLELESDAIALQGNIKAYFGVLNHLLGTSLSLDTTLEVPEVEDSMDPMEITRPEQQVFEAKETLLKAEEGAIHANRVPKLSLFAQGGVGYPNPLNFSDISTSTYALGGLRINWNIFDWQISEKEIEKIELQIEQVHAEKATFEFDIKSRQAEFRERITALYEQIKNDTEIVSLQKDILDQTQTQLQEGVIQSNDYVTQLNSELSARQQLELHKVQLQQLQIDYLTLFGKL